MFVLCKTLGDIKREKKEFDVQNILHNAETKVNRSLWYRTSFNLPMGTVSSQERGYGAQHFSYSFNHRISFSRIHNTAFRKADLALSNNKQWQERCHYFLWTGHLLSHESGTTRLRLYCSASQGCFFFLIFNLVIVFHINHQNRFSVQVARLQNHWCPCSLDEEMERTWTRRHSERFYITSF